jgi:hypothetical protein
MGLRINGQVINRRGAVFNVYLTAFSKEGFECAATEISLA